MYIKFSSNFNSFEIMISKEEIIESFKDEESFMKYVRKMEELKRYAILRCAIMKEVVK